MAPMKYLARDFIFKISTDGVAYTRIGGINEWGDSLEGNDADTADFDSGGWGSALTASLNYRVSMSGQFLVDPRTGARDAGQQAVEVAARQVGPLGLRYYQISAVPRMAFSADAATDVLTVPGHSFQNGDQVEVLGTDLPTGLAEGSYFVINRTATTIQLSTTSGGTAVNFTGSGAGEVGVVLGSISMQANTRLQERGGGNDDPLSWGADTMSYGRPTFTGCFA